MASATEAGVATEMRKTVLQDDQHLGKESLQGDRDSSRTWGPLGTILESSLRRVSTPPKFPMERGPHPGLGLGLSLA